MSAPDGAPGGAYGNIVAVIVDDHALVRQGLAAVLLQDQRIRLAGEAANGREALEMLEEAEPDFVLLDYQMPEMNGAECAREIRKRWPHVTVIGMSAQGDFVGEQMVKAGADGFVLKSTPPREMLGVILELTENRKLGAR